MSFSGLRMTASPGFISRQAARRPVCSSGFRRPTGGSEPMATLAFNHEEIAARELKPALYELDGISRETVEAHYKLYQGYVNKRNELLGRLAEVDLTAANQVYSDVRALKVDLTFAIGGIKNHELYFEHLGGYGGYLAGSMPFGYWLVRLTKGVDIRAVGSGNIGATNVWRTFGWRYGLPVVLLDTAKGFGPALAATLAIDHLAGVLAGGAAMLGHWRPLFLRFAKGGKLVATTGGAFLGVAPAVGGIGAGVWIVTFLLTRYASVASIVAAASLPAVAA